MIESVSDKHSQWSDSGPIEINILWLKSDHFDQNTKIEVDTAVSMGLWNTCIGFIGKVSRPLIVDHPTSFKDRFNWWRVFRLQCVVVGMMATKQLNWMENLQSLFCISTFFLNWFRFEILPSVQYTPLCQTPFTIRIPNYQNYSNVKDQEAKQVITR